ncbi:YcaO-like family protein [Pseudoalteromonas rubra]|uniref:YcaO-like family protein n=1 Tax=Pseudoalteromonas rubra TaxID=43658 RepID=UPI0013DE3C28|nr:YcaO-like family protein [Pseudoalteromonas rubra]
MKDDILECEIFTCIISKIASAALPMDTLLSELPFPPAIIMRKVNTLVKSGVIYSISKDVDIETELPIKELKSISQSYFSELVLQDEIEESDLTCSDGQIKLSVNISRSCLECVRERILSHRPYLSLVRKNRDKVKVIYPESVNVDCPIDNNQSNILFEVELKNGHIEKHPIFHTPLCKKVKYKNSNNEEFIIDFSKRSKYRLTSPKETIEKLKPYISKYVGVIHSLEPYGKLDSRYIFNYVAGRNAAFSYSNRSWVLASLRSANGGKGKTKQQAQCSALCEAIERYSMLHHGRPVDKYATTSELDLRYYEPNKLLNFNEERLNTASSCIDLSIAPQHWLPRKFNHEEPIHWKKVYSLSSMDEVYLPAEIVYAQMAGIDDTERLAMPDSNGCASGNTILEAAFQGTLELIERDAVAIWWYNKLNRVAVDITTISSEYIANIRSEINAMGRTLDIIEITSDIDVPVYVAVSYNKIKENEIIYGFGAHTDPLIAVERCVTEVCQLMPAINNPQTSISEPEFAKWLSTQFIQEHSYLNASALPVKKFERSMDKVNQHLEVSMSELINKLKKVGVELLGTNLTLPDTNFPVVKMFAPGLRHFWRRTAPGRLFDVPVNMALICKKKIEAELNGHNISI